jgi:hypothetical protein
VLLVGHGGGSPDRSSLLIRITEGEPDDQATDSEHRNENHSGNPTAPSLMPPRLLDQLRAPNHGPVWRLVPRVVIHGSRNLLDDLNELVAPIPMMSSKGHEPRAPTGPISNCGGWNTSKQNRCHRSWSMPGGMCLAWLALSRKLRQLP